MAPSKTNQTGGAKAKYEEGKVVSHFTSEAESESSTPAATAGDVLRLKPRAYSSGEARTWNSIEIGVVVEFVGEEGRGSSSYCKKYQLLFLTIQCFEGIFQAGSTSTYNLTPIPNQRSKHARAPRMSTQPIRYIMMCQLAQVRANAHRLSRSQFRQRDSKSGETHIQRSLLAQNSGWDVAVAEVEDVGRENQPAASLFSSSSKRVNLGVRRSQSIPRRVQRRAGEGVGLLICSWDFVGQA